jgi:cell filamentation protein
VDDPYCYPGTNCLRNELRTRDPDVLRQVEARIVSVREVAIARETLPGEYDLDHLKRFHRYLFRDVYAWAGETRTVDIARSGAPFAHWRYVDDHVSSILDDVRRAGWLIGLKFEPFVERLAHYYGELNAAHPFREGNGRTQRAFLRQLSAAAGYRLEWSQLDPGGNTNACELNLLRADAGPLVEVLRSVVSRM